MALHTLFFVSLLIFSLVGSILVFTLIDSSRGATKLFSDLQNSLEVTAKPIRDGVVLEPGKDMVRITWKLKSSAKVDADAAFKTVEVKLCYAPISQDDRPWRMTHKELYKDKTCPFKIVSKPYDKIPQSLNWTLDLDIPTGTYFVRAYGKDAKGHEVAYGQSTDAEKTTNLFSVQGISGHHLSLDIASMFFSVFSVVSLFVFFVKAKKSSRVRTEEVSSITLAL